MGRYYWIGGYRGMTSKFQKKISPVFESEKEALNYRDANRLFSLSLDMGKLKEVKDGDQGKKDQE